MKAVRLTENNVEPMTTEGETGPVQTSRFWIAHCLARLVDLHDEQFLTGIPVTRDGRLRQSWGVAAKPITLARDGMHDAGAYPGSVDPVPPLGPSRFRLPIPPDIVALPAEFGSF